VTSSLNFLFGLTAFLYLVSTSAYVAHFYLRQGGKAATATGLLAFGCHTLTLGLLVFHLRHPPLYSGFEALFSLAWVVMLNYLLFELLTGLRVAGAFLLPLTLFFLIYAGVLPRPWEAAGVPLASYWVLVHSLVALAGYGALTLAFAAAVMYLLQERKLRRKDFHLFYQRLPSLDTLDSLAYRFVLYGFPLLSLGIVIGSLWARQAWGLPFLREPKELFSVLLWLVYAAYLGARVLLGWRGRRAAYLLVGGFGLLVFNFFVVNLFLSRRHVF
jgi:cytochrome c-type biogenesis protein CcsB